MDIEGEGGRRKRSRSGQKGKRKKFVGRVGGGEGRKEGIASRWRRLWGGCLMEIDGMWGSGDVGEVLK
jgi:hypothetical protein